MVSQNYSIHAVAIAMQICLMLSEPQRSGLGGSSTMVLVRNTTTNECEVLDGFEMFSNISYIRRQKTKENKERVSECVDTIFGGGIHEKIQIPSEVVTMIQLLKDVPIHEIRPLFDLLDHESLVSTPMSLPLYITARTMSLKLLSYGYFDWLYTRREQYRTLQEGERLSISAEWLSAVAQVAYSNPADSKRWDKMLEQASDMLLCRCQSRFLIKNVKEHALENWKKALGVGWKRIDTGILNGHRVCMPEPFGPLMSHVAEKRVAAVDGVISKNLVHIFHALKFLYESTSSPTNEIDDAARSRRHAKNSDEEEEILDGLTPNAEMANSWASNMFVVVDRRTQSAIAYVGTLGHTFGSLVHTGHNFYLNNLAEIKKEADQKPDNGFHRLLPVIAFQPDKITLAYAASGGGQHLSKSGPRTVSVLILNKIANVTIDNAVVYPIFYPAGTNDHLAHKEGVPFLEILHIDRVVLDTDNVNDESVAIEAKGETRRYSNFSKAPLRTCTAALKIIDLF